MTYVMTYLRNEMERDTFQMMVVVTLVGTYSDIWYGTNFLRLARVSLRAVSKSKICVNML